jgi:hypothetical protein
LRYEYVNKMLADTFLDGRYDSRPLYMTLDRVSRQELAGRLGVSDELVEETTCHIVAKSLRSQGHLYGKHEDNLKEWEARKTPWPPPFLGVLFLLSHAAELMVSDEKFSSANYYSRLSQITGIQRDRLSQYGHSTEGFWLAFNKWLRSTSFVFGRPTARSVNSFAYVGLAMSQAILREADRRNIHLMFERFGFSGTDSVSEEDLHQYLADWVQGPRATRQLKLAWSRPELQSRICEIAAAEIFDWPGTIGDETVNGGPRASRLSLAATIVPRFPSRRIGLFLGIERSIDQEIGVAIDGSAGRLVLSNTILGNFATLEGPGGLNIDEALGRGVDLRSTRGSGTFAWRPRLVVPLRRSEKGPYWTEVSRAGVGVELIVLVKDFVRVKSDLDEYLAEVALPGYTVARQAQLPGLPQGWLLYEKVSILRAGVEAGEDLAPLVPVSEGRALMIGGGLRLAPGIWHTKSLPRASIETLGRSLAILALDGSQEGAPPFQQAGPSTGMALLELDRKVLPRSGAVRLKAVEGEQSIAEVGILIRSADRPRPLDRKGEGQLAYLGVSSAAGLPQSDAVDLVRGLATSFAPVSIVDDGLLSRFQSIALTSASSEDPEQLLGEMPPMEDQRAIRRGTAGLSINEILALSCVERGCHCWRVPEFSPGLSRDALITVTCSDCGATVVTRRSPRRTRSRRSETIASTPPPPPPPRQVGEGSSQRIRYDLFLDALCFQGSGSRGQLETLLSDQLDEPWRGHIVARDLALLGHLDLELQPGSGRIKRWCVAPPALVFNDDGVALLSGFRSGRLLKQIHEASMACGATLTSEKLRGQPSIIRISGLTARRAADIFTQIKDPHGRPLTVVDEAASRLAAACISLGGLFLVLVPATLGAGDPVERYDLRKAQWEPTRDTSSEGALRLRRAGVEYIYADGRGRFRRGSPELVKLLHARANGAQLHAYDPGSKEFTSSLGCEPPMLLARCLVASTGRLPAVADGRSTFRNVSAAVAGVVLNELYRGEVPS